jgi:hypothetical protein
MRLCVQVCFLSKTGDLRPCYTDEDVSLGSLLARATFSDIWAPFYNMSMSPCAVRKTVVPRQTLFSIEQRHRRAKETTARGASGTKQTTHCPVMMQKAILNKGQDLAKNRPLLFVNAELQDQWFCPS